MGQMEKQKYWRSVSGQPTKLDKAQLDNTARRTHSAINNCGGQKSKRRQKEYRYLWNGSSYDEEGRYKFISSQVYCQAEIHNALLPRLEQMAIE